MAYLTLFTVYQTQQALVLEFGKPKREIKDPGLHYKIPFIQNVEYFDKRILDIDTASQEVIASDKKARGRRLCALPHHRPADVLPERARREARQFADRRHPRSLAPARARRRDLPGVVRDKREALMRTS